MDGAPIPSSPRYRFADLTLDVGQRRLWRDDEPIALSKLTFVLLQVLVEAAPNLVTHAELAQRVWGPRRVVTPENVAKRVMRLRHALGDQANSARYVEGVRGQGYRMIPTVEVVARIKPEARRSEPAAAAASATAPAPLVARSGGDSSPRAPRRMRALRLIAVVALVGAAAMLAWSTHLLPSMLGDSAEGRAVQRDSTKIVVLPFANLSPDPAQRYFADGLTDELIIALQRLPGVQVMSRTTSLALRDTGRAAKDIATDLDVGYVLEGSVGNEGRRLRVRAQLSDAAGFSVLPYSYEGTADNLFDVQDEIVAAIAAAVRAPLGLEPAVERAGTNDVEAYELYLAAKLECIQGNMSPEGFERTLARMDRALRLDPNFARAWMFKSQVHIVRSNFVAHGAAELAAAEYAATRAIGLSPENGDGYNARALLLGTRGDWPGAERDYERAHARGVTEFPHDVSFILSAGRIGKARARIEQLLDIDPLNEDLFGFLALTHEMTGSRSKADDVYRRGKLLYDPWQFGNVVGGWIRLGRHEVEPLYADVELPPPLAALAARIDDLEAARVLLMDAVRDPQSQSPTNLANLAVWAAYLGENEIALRLLSRAFAGSALLTYVAWLPVFDEVRELPAFKSLLVDIGLVDYWRSTGWPDVCRPTSATDFDCTDARLEEPVPKNSG
jgi:TolB-like protein/DNA-binding winged helix-turn-helix (wHTH) protein/Tfp pilus assembly protein PilF